jgi:hypothetical protein
MRKNNFLGNLLENRKKKKCISKMQEKHKSQMNIICFTLTCDACALLSTRGRGGGGRSGLMLNSMGDLTNLLRSGLY